MSIVEAKTKPATVDSQTDAVLVTKILAGDSDAFEPIMRRYNQRLFRLARSIVSNDADAMDVVQEAYFRAYLNLHVLKDTQAFGAWLENYPK